MTNEASKAAAALLGRSGGRAGRGEAKRRGDSAYYSKLGSKRLSSKVDFAAGQVKQAIRDLRCGPETAYLWTLHAARAAFKMRPDLR